MLLRDPSGLSRRSGENECGTDREDCTQKLPGAKQARAEIAFKVCSDFPGIGNRHALFTDGAGILDHHGRLRAAFF